MGKIFGPLSFPHFVLFGFVCARTAPRLLAIVVIVACGACTGLLFCRWSGTPIAPIGLPAATALSCLLFSLLLWVLLLGRLLLIYPLPACRNGKCSGYTAYSWSIMSIYGRIRWDRYLYQCKCGDHYLRHRKRFIEIVAPEPSDSQFGEWIPITEANTRAYKRLSGFRNWIDDNGPIKF